jgi:hypothetical protein
MKAYFYTEKTQPLKDWLMQALELGASYTEMETDSGTVIISDQEPPDNDGEITKEAAKVAAPEGFELAAEGVK